MDEPFETAGPEAMADCISARSRRELGGLGFELHAHADDLGCRQLGRHGAHTSSMRLEVVLGHVDQCEHRLVRQQEQTRRRPAAWGPCRCGRRGAGGQQLVGDVEGGDLVGDGPVLLGRLAPLLDLVLDRLEVGQGQLDLEDPQALERVGRAGHVVVLERPQQVHDRVDLADVGEELVAESLTGAGPLDQAPDVDELHAGRHTLRELDMAASLSSRSSGPWPPRVRIVVAKA